MVILFQLGILSFFVGSTRAMGHGDEGSEGIEREIQDVQAHNARWASDPLALTHIAGLYLDIGNERSRR